MKAPTRTKGQQTAGVILVLLLFGGCWYAVATTDPGLTTTPPSPAAPPPAVTFDLSVDSCSRRGDATWIEGSVRNTGEAQVQFVQVRLTFEDGDGSVVDTGQTYAVGAERLRPGEASAFQGYTRHSQARRCAAQILDYRRVR